MTVKPLDDLEMFELLQAAYPEKFADDEDETFEAALNFADDLSGFEELADLLGRVVMLTMPMKSGLTEKCVKPRPSGRGRKARSPLWLLNPPPVNQRP